MGCIFQLLTDGLLYETLECYWIHFFIPLLAIKEVRRAVSTLQAEVTKLLSIVDDDGFYIDASEYFNVSYRLAAVFPDLWESVVVRSYHTTQPPVHLSHNANNEANNGTIFGNSLMSSLLRRSVVVAGTMMLYFGTINIRLQKMVITVSQPLILAGICWMFYEMAHVQWIVIIPCLGLFLLLVHQLRYHTKAGSGGDSRIGVDSDNASSRNRDKSLHQEAGYTDSNDDTESAQPPHQRRDRNECSRSISSVLVGAGEDEVRGVESVDGDGKDSSDFGVMAKFPYYDSKGSAGGDGNGRREANRSSLQSGANLHSDFDEGFSDCQSATDDEMPDDFALVSDENGDCHLEFRYGTMTIESLLNCGRDKATDNGIEDGVEDVKTVGVSEAEPMASNRPDRNRKGVESSDINETDEERTERLGLMSSHISSLPKGEPISTEVTAMYANDVNALLDMVMRHGKPAPDQKEQEDPEVVEFNRAFEDHLNS